MKEILELITCDMTVQDIRFFTITGSICIVLLITLVALCFGGRR